MGFELLKVEESKSFAAKSNQAGFYFSVSNNGIVLRAEYGEVVSTTEKDIEKYKKKALAVIQDEEEFTKGKTIADGIDCWLRVDGTSVSERVHKDKSKFTSQALQLIPQATSILKVEASFYYGDMTTSYDVLCPSKVGRERFDLDDAAFFMSVSNRN